MGYLPSKARNEGKALQHTDQSLQPKIVSGGALLIAGVSKHYTPLTAGEIAAQWEAFARHIGSIPGQVGKLAYGVIYNLDPRGEYDYLCGVEIGEGRELLPEMTTLAIPPQRYAVVTHTDNVSTISKTWGAMHSRWLPGSGLQAAAGPAFERYTESFDGATGEGGVEIWLPIAD
jgi:AraC family transcriptional regulator